LRKPKHFIKWHSRCEMGGLNGKIDRRRIKDGKK
jgi:hypothetical protein